MGSGFNLTQLNFERTVLLSKLREQLVCILHELVQGLDDSC